jgi:alpha-glucosidase (family GH31 glycosyl hydrolase)
VQVPLDEIPVWVRPGSIICLGPEKTGRPDYDYTKGLEIRVYELAEGESVETHIPGSTGGSVAAIRAEKKNDEIMVKTVSGKCEIAALGVFGETIKGAKGGSVESGLLAKIIVQSGATEVVVKI